MPTATSNLNLLETVAAELAFEPRVSAEKISVGAKDGIVTLTGTVPNYAQKVAATEAALRVAGVRAVADELTVELPSMHRHTDADIAISAANILKANVLIPADNIKVMVENGWITLTGTVSWQYQRATAESALSHIYGVRGILNRITIVPHVTATSVRDQLRQAFERLADVDAEKLRIETDGGAVRIDGTVRSWSESSAIVRAAYSVPGVTKVENHTIVV